MNVKSRLDDLIPAFLDLDGEMINPNSKENSNKKRYSYNGKIQDGLLTEQHFEVDSNGNLIINAYGTIYKLYNPFITKISKPDVSVSFHGNPTPEMEISASYIEVLRQEYSTNEIWSDVFN